MFAVAVIAAGLFSYQYFDQAVPFVKVAITMDNTQARKQAVELAEKYDWGVSDFNIATQYQADSQLQAFVELEGGGKQAFVEMIEKDYHQPYEWHVRFYKQQEIKEVLVGFTPSGKPYEFLIKLPETLVGPALSKDDALVIAKKGAQSWGVDLTPFDLVEHHKEEIVSGRFDHLFIFERKDVSLMDGKYRLKLKVSGDIFSELQHTVKVPEEFDRRYAEMFSTNKMVAGLARNVMFLLYLFIFALFAFVFFFYSKGGLLWSKIFKLMGMLAVLFFLDACNTWSSIWNHYPTHMTSTAFIFQKIIEIFAQSTAFIALICFIVLTTEAAGRYVFGKHIQFFRLWSSGVAGSYQVLQQTLLGYGGAVIMLGYTIGFYLFAQKLGWWTPLNTLIDPNILSTKVPCFTPLFISFRAGFWEEFMCRGLPLAGILLLAHRMRYKWILFSLVFVLQIVIFGALHANYPQQPAYYRIVELIVDSVGLGALYYWFGLLPGIICHFVYDAMLFSLPIFVSNLWGQQLLTVLIILIPLFVVFRAWILQQRSFKNVADDAYNQAAKIEPENKIVADTKTLTGQAIGQRMILGAFLLGLIGLLVWRFSKEFQIDTAPITVTPAQVEVLAQKAVADYFQPLGSEWTMTRNYISPTLSMGGKYIWQTFGSQGYQKLQSNYILQPSYAVKFVKFEGQVEDRSELFEVVVQANGTVDRLQHAIPEFWPGADLDESQAQSLAYNFIEKFYDLHQSDLQLVSSQSVKHAQRRDWTIVVKDIKNYPFDQGQARVSVAISGDSLSHIYRFVNTPEQWQRSEQNRMTQESLLHLVLYVLVICWCLCFVLISLDTFCISVRYFTPFIIFTCCFVFLRFSMVANDWFATLYNFSNSEPINHQIINIIGSGIIGFLCMGAGLAILLMSVIGFGVRSADKKLVVALPLGVALGSILYGIISIFKYFEPAFIPNSPYNAFSNCVLPVFAILTSYFVLQIMTAVITLASLFVVIDKICHRYGYRWLQPALFMFAGMVISPLAQLSNISLWIASGVALGLAWYLIHRYFLMRDSALIWIIVATMQILQIMPSAWYGAYPGVEMQVLGSSALILAIILYLYRKI